MIWTRSTLTCVDLTCSRFPIEMTSHLYFFSLLAYLRLHLLTCNTTMLQTRLSRTRPYRYIPSHQKHRKTTRCFTVLTTHNSFESDQTIDMRSVHEIPENRMGAKLGENENVPLATTVTIPAFKVSFLTNARSI